MNSPTHSPLAFICGHRKSGTTLLANLLDGHPQLAVYPVDLVLLYAYFPDFIRQHDGPAERRTRLERILFSDLRQRLDSALLNVDAVAGMFFDGLADDDLARLDILIGRLMAAFQSVTGRGIESTRFGIFKETSIEIYAAEMLTWFPDARFIHVVRDPRDNFAALAAGVDGYYGRMGEDHNRTLASLLNRVGTGLRMARTNRAQFGDQRYLTLRFEDIATDPETSMRRVADFIGVAFTPSLLKPSLLGQPTGGNAFDGVATFGVSSRNVERWRDRIASADAQVIEFHLGEYMEEFGYRPAFDDREQARAAAEFYKWQNYAYFYSDRFAHGVSR
ncbi:sulfotransferase family protein [Pseudorhodoplanes sp.]|uniref:sulfotransferase family protein n=1 Tax=Pseudorhodoplanes sp. TaxID=1934341 RepID=UPI003D0E319C